MSSALPTAAVSRPWPAVLHLSNGRPSRWHTELLLQLRSSLLCVCECECVYCWGGTLQNVAAARVHWPTWRGAFPLFSPLFHPPHLFFSSFIFPSVLHRLLVQVPNLERGLAGIRRLAHSHIICHCTSPSIGFHWATRSSFVIYWGISEWSPQAIRLIHSKRKSISPNQHWYWNYTLLNLTTLDFRFFPHQLLIIVKYTLCTVLCVVWW